MTRIPAATKLKELVCICSYCKRIRGNGEQWEQLEHYITEHSGVEFSHGVCPECSGKILEPKLTELVRSRARRRRVIHSHASIKSGDAPRQGEAKIACATRTEEGANDTPKRGDA